MCNQHQFQTINFAARLQACVVCGETRTVSVETLLGMDESTEISLAHHQLDTAGIPREIAGGVATLPVRIAYLAGLLESAQRFGAQSIRYDRRSR
jgi:hypothetical protein